MKISSKHLSHRQNWWLIFIKINLYHHKINFNLPSKE